MEREREVGRGTRGEEMKVRMKIERREEERRGRRGKGRQEEERKRGEKRKSRERGRFVDGSTQSLSFVEDSTFVISLSLSYSISCT